MGLDMYLTKKTYIGANFKHRNVKGEISLTEGDKNKPIKIDLKRVSYIEEQVGYWRKANQIHKWFVDNVQEGEDDCEEYEVSEEQLEKLLADCKKVKLDSQLAASILPTQSGFFFGGTEYDEFYMQEIDDTIEIIESLLKEKEEGDTYLNGEIYYRSSW